MIASIKHSFVLVTLLSLSHAISLSPYTYLAHPLYELNDTLIPKFKSAISAPAPVVVQKYYVNPNTSTRTTKGAIFLPRSASYETFASIPYLTLVDTLYAPGGKKIRNFLQVHLNHAARVSVLLTNSRINRKVLTGPLSVRAPSGWKTTTAVRSSTGSPPIVGDYDRLGEIKLPFQGVLVERLIAKGEFLTLPHPNFFVINGIPASRFVIFFSQVSSLQDTPISFPYPPVPKKITLPIAGTRIDPESVTPNSACPTWLHDIHVTKSREDPEVTKDLKDLPYWRTWHPQIDPIYWCYYGHEHGAYPGPHRPMLGYTAWKTFDENGYMQRQDESHEGFKVFAFPLRQTESGKADKFVIIVVHMHLAFARRFLTRFHTVSFAVWGGNDRGKLEAEFHMKMDFGAAIVPRTNGKDVPMDSSQEEILDQLLHRKRAAGRRFNVLNIDNNYPESVDEEFRLNKRARPTEKNKKMIMRGLYEQWEGSLNTCSQTKAKLNRGFKFDVRDPSTAIRFLNDTTDDKIQHLLGKSINRFMLIPNVVYAGAKYCWFDVFTSDTGVNLELNDGVFYTDSFFKSILKGPGKYSLRQFIIPGWKGIQFPKGKIESSDEWSGWMTYSKKGVRLRSIEGAVDRLVN